MEEIISKQNKKIEIKDIKYVGEAICDYFNIMKLKTGHYLYIEQ